MGRGLLAGTFWGLVIAAVIIVLASQISVRQTLSLPQPAAAPVEVPGGTEFDQARAEVVPVIPTPDQTAQIDPTVRPSPPPETETPPQSVDTATLDQPVRAQAAPSDLDAPAALAPVEAPSPASEALTTPQTASVVAAPATDSAPVEPLPAAQAPERAATLDGPLDAPQAPPATDAPATSVAAASASLDSPSAPSLPQAERSVDVGAAPSAPARPTVEAAVSAPQTTLDVTQSPAVPRGEALAAAPGVAATTPSVVAPDAPDTPPLEVAALPLAEPTLPAQPMPQTPEPETQAAQPAAIPAPAGVPLQDDIVQVPQPEARETTDLPRIIRPESAPLPSAAASDPLEDATEPLEEDADPRAIVANAIPFDVTPGTALVAIVLVHEGNLPPAPDQIEDLPPEVAFAVPAALPAARTIAAAYRNAGREVVAIPDLTGTAQADAVIAAFDAVPSAVAIMDDPAVGFASDRNTLSSLIAALSASGHGLITHPRGFNSTQQAAERDGVPSRLVFRTLDADAQSDDAIRRQLDQATFRARQDRSVVLTVRSGLSSVSAVVEWALANRTGQVALAPVSAALLVE
ncbi:MAG: divergent polysaccharide deacetylase family protein [Pseudomonadota bacterium]